ncbi:7994_t:CDS:2 [Funneliformis mosseae]|uniref:7994_t:CDS:1 n=1 Tax=Funneliformis mosseae TaxID=27381 RepID=A0A9N8WCU3_FUNMO|nr:7994_t:CDS:2 [Funneliformis mosseae]
MFHPILTGIKATTEIRRCKDWQKGKHKGAEVSARIRNIEADKHLIMVRTNKASETLSDFANVEYNVRKKRKQNHQSGRYTSPTSPSPTLRNSLAELSRLTDNPFLEEESETDGVIAIDHRKKKEVYLSSHTIKEMSAFVDEMETLLRIQEIFYESFNILYAKLCTPSQPSNKVTLKKDTEV